MYNYDPSAILAIHFAENRELIRRAAALEGKPSLSTRLIEAVRPVYIQALRTALIRARAAQAYSSRVTS